MQEYYIIINGEQTGPFSFDELLNQRITPDTLIWRYGLTDWVKASDLPEYEEIMHKSHSTPPPFGGDFSNNPQYGIKDDSFSHSSENFNSYNYNRQHYHWNNNNQSTPVNWLPWAIVATITGFIFSFIGVIFGIIGIINANKANNLYASGNEKSANEANSTAKTMTIIGLSLAGIGFIGAGISLHSIPFIHLL